MINREHDLPITKQALVLRISRADPRALAGPSTRLDRQAVLRCGRGPDAVEELLFYPIVRVECQNDRIEIAERFRSMYSDATMMS